MTTTSMTTGSSVSSKAYSDVVCDMKLCVFRSQRVSPCVRAWSLTCVRPRRARWLLCARARMFPLTCVHCVQRQRHASATTQHDSHERAMSTKSRCPSNARRQHSRRVTLATKPRRYTPARAVTLRRPRRLIRVNLSRIEPLP